jgi:peptidoglycan hydrolase CwlO-like protein
MKRFMLISLMKAPFLNNPCLGKSKKKIVAQGGFGYWEGMRVKKMLYALAALFLGTLGVLGTAVSSPATEESQIDAIDAKIAELEEKKKGFEARVLRHENLAEYLQFDQQAVLETRRHLQLADENRAKVEWIQKEIDLLKEKRDKLLGK